MRHSSVSSGLVALLVISLIALVGCAEKTPEQTLVEARANYSASLGGWSVMEPPAAEPVDEMLGDEALGEEDAAVADEMQDAAGDGEEGEQGGEELIADPQPELKTVFLDILIRNKNESKLPGITLDVSQANEAGDEIGHWRIWVDTSTIERGPGTQVDHLLEGIEVVEGYGFSVEIRSPVAEADRGEYREFAELP